MLSPLEHTAPSSDTALLPKPAPNDSQRAKVSYFHPDIHSKIVERAKKENLIAELYDSKRPEEKPKDDPRGKPDHAGKVDHLGKAGRIVSDLLRRHGEAKEKISKLREEARQGERQARQGAARAGGEKFVFRGSMIERNQVWLEEKKRREIERKEEALVSDLQQCTFSPEISSRRMSQIYLRNKSRLNQDHSRRDHKTPTEQPPPSPLRTKKDISLTQFESAKKEIKTRLFTIPLRN